MSPQTRDWVLDLLVVVAVLYAVITAVRALLLFI
jgi:hypothetical protein